MDRTVSRTIRESGLLGAGDRVLVGVSGGKDSLVLLHLLAARQAWRHERYELTACHVEDGVCTDDCGFTRTLEELCAGLDVPLRVVRERTIPEPAELGGRSPCFVCSWRRRRLLFETAVAEGCSLLALGHHQDDLAETMLLNLLWHGRHETMPARRSMFGGRVTIVRPLADVQERDIRYLARIGELPVHGCTCAYAGDSKREVVAELLRQVRQSGCRGASANLVRSAGAGARSSVEQHG